MENDSEGALVQIGNIDRGTCHLVIKHLQRIPGGFQHEVEEANTETLKPNGLPKHPEPTPL